MKYLITGGAGFIGSALIRHLINATEHSILNVDCLTYAANLDSLTSVSKNSRYSFKKIDICNLPRLKKVISDYEPEAIMHLAAESHVDRSIDSPHSFLHTNILGTFNLLEATREYLGDASNSIRKNFRFHHISTDEVYGDLVGTDDLFTENTPYSPSSPYSASKASSDHLVRAWGRTFDIPFIITNCSNNYGPFQFPEKLIPHTILNALHGKPIPIYGTGNQVRDWLHVEDHALALSLAVSKGSIGETYNIGGYNEKKNIEVVNVICNILDELLSPKNQEIKSYKDLITFVEDRPGHDQRYAIDSSKFSNQLNWRPSETFESGITKTVKWYIDNSQWWQRIHSGDYRFTRIGKKH